MGKIATGSTSVPAAQVDWPALKAQILDRLNVTEEYGLLGVKLSSNSPSPKGFQECYAVDRLDHVASAAFHVKSGVYVDAGGEHLTLGFFDFALRFGRFGSWMDCLKHYAEKAGVPVGRVEFSGSKVLEQVYRYTEADGSLSYGVFRYRTPNGKKDFRQYPWRDGAWVKEKGCMEGIHPLPYRLPELIAAPKEDTIYAVEGERDADRLMTEGLVATTNSQGSKSTDQTWPRDSFLPHFKGRDVVVIPDNDKPGRDHAHRVCRTLIQVALRVRFLELPGLPIKGDVSDWLDMGHTIDELGRLAFRALDWSPELAIDEVKLGPGSGIIIPPDVQIDPNDIVLKRLSSVTRREVRWLIPGKIPLGKLTLLAGDPGLGKSFITMDLAARLSVGGSIPGCPGECFEPASSLLFFAEDGEDDTVVPRLMDAGADLDKILTMESVRDSMGRLTPFNLGYLDHLDYALSQIGDCRLVVIDPVANYIGREADEHRNAEIRAVLTPLAKLAEKRDVAVVLVTHINKGSTTKALSRITGSIAYSALARAVWLVAKDHDNPNRRLVLSVKNNLAPDQSGLAYEIVDSRVKWDDESISITANEALADPADRPSFGKKKSSKTIEEAAEWVKSYLEENGTTLSSTIMSEGVKAGFGRDSLYSCKDLLGIRARKSGNGENPWTWSLPLDLIGEVVGASAGRDSVPF